MSETTTSTIETKETKYRDWFIQRSFYFDTHNEKEELISDKSVDEWKKEIQDLFFSSIGDEEYCAMIFHDSDLLTDGSLKPLHVHALFHFKSPRYQSGVMKLLGITRKENCQRARAKSSSARYLCHISSDALDSDKHIYHIENVITRNCNYRELIKQKSSKKANKKDIEEFIARLSHDIQSGLLSFENTRSEIIDTFGNTEGQKIWRTFRDNLKKDFQEYLTSKANDYIKHGRNLINFFINGKGGTGKSRLAKALAFYYADNESIHVSAAHGKNKTFDLVSTYRGQRISLLNEASATSFSFREFCAVFDPFEYAPVNSRNADKPWLAEKMFMTTTDTFDFFVKTVAETSDDRDKKKKSDNIYQVTRRFKYIISGTKVKGNKTKFELSEFDNDTRKFEILENFICDDVVMQINKTAREIADFIEKSHQSDTLASND